MDGSPTLLLPVENQARELDAKLFLAEVAARRGFEVILGSRTQLDYAVGGLRPGLYLSKSLTRRSLRMFRILRQLGFRVVAWDEEAVVHYPDPVYWSRRLDRDAMGAIDHLLAWGSDNRRLWTDFSGYAGTPITVTGNPRGDLLRPELRGYFDEEVSQLRTRFGRYLLINTNFGNVNAFFPHLNLLYEGADGKTAYGTAATGMEPEYAEGRAQHKQAIFSAFLAMIPKLAALHPERALLIRPHPTEKREIYEELARGHANLEVVHGGSVIPWLLASDGVIHNGCTTAVEAFALGVPTFAFQPVVDPHYDDALPNALSQVCRDEAVLFAAVANGSPVAASAAQQTLFDEYVGAQAGPFAADRILEVLRAESQRGRASRPALWTRWLGRAKATRRWLVKGKIRGRAAGHKHNESFQRHRFPGVTGDEVLQKLRRFASLRGVVPTFRVDPIAPHLYSIRTE